MTDLNDRRWMYLKAVLFLIIGISSAVIILMESRSFLIGFLLLLTVWGLCRAYYFAFYVIERYIEPGFKFSGLISLGCYLLRKRQTTRR